MGDLGNVTGNKPNWSQIIDSDNPQDIYGLTQAQASNIAQAIGFSGKSLAGVASDMIIIKYLGTSAPTLTDFAALPIGSLIIAPRLTASTIYIHKAQSVSPVVGDWFYLQGTVVS